MTSNGERDFPPAFMRRCLHHQMELPTKERLLEIVTQHLKLTENDKNLAIVDEVVEAFVNKRDGVTDNREKSELATDQLLNALYLRLNLKESEIFNDVVWHSLD